MLTFTYFVVCVFASCALCLAVTMNCRLGFCFAENSPAVERTGLWHKWGWAGCLVAPSLFFIPVFTPTPHPTPSPSPARLHWPKTNTGVPTPCCLQHESGGSSGWWPADLQACPGAWVPQGHHLSAFNYDLLESVSPGGPLGGLATSCLWKVGILSGKERRRRIAVCEGETESGLT